MTQTVIGYFDTPDAAHAAEEKLARSGIAPGALHLAAEDVAYAGAQRQQTRTGGASGLRRFFSELFGADDADDLGNYAEAVRRGGVVLAVDVPDEAAVDTVREALLDAGAVDIDERVEQWRQAGYTGYNPDAPTYSADEVGRERNAVLPVIEEGIEVGKREVGTGTVRVYARTVETPFREDVTLREEHATIERRPVDRPATEEDLQNLGERSIEVREMAEKAVVSKSARVVAEVEVGKEVTQRTETVEDTLRHTEIGVDRDARETRRLGDPSGAGEDVRSRSAASLRRAYEDYEPDFRSDFATRYGSSGSTYDEYAPAYRFGYGLAEDPRYRDHDWSAIASDVERDWSERYPGSAWQRFKMAIRHGWERVTGDR